MAQRVPYEVVGIVGDVKQRRLESAFLPHMYTPMTQTPWGAMSFVVRTSLDRASVASAVTREMQALDSNLPAAHVRTMYEVMADSVARQRLNMLLLGIFGGLALLLATVGVYGVMSYIVSQRSQEFGIRMALGARRRDLVSLVIGQASRMAIAGLAIGIVAALVLTRTLRTLLFEVRAADPVTFLVITALLGIIALLASYVPALRASRVDPMVALRYE